MNEHSLPELAILFNLIPILIVSVCCGGLVGINLEVRNKSAGIKTNMIVCFGAALFTALSALIPEGTGAALDQDAMDPGRLAAQVVAGIGFVAAGAIQLWERKNPGIPGLGAWGDAPVISGISTAATLWVVASIGMAVGLGYLKLGIFSSLIVVVVIHAVRGVKHLLLRLR